MRVTNYRGNQIKISRKVVRKYGRPQPEEVTMRIRGEIDGWRALADALPRAMSIHAALIDPRKLDQVGAEHPFRKAMQKIHDSPEKTREAVQDIVKLIELSQSAGIVAANTGLVELNKERTHVHETGLKQRLWTLSYTRRGLSKTLRGTYPYDRRLTKEERENARHEYDEQASRFAALGGIGEYRRLYRKYGDLLETLPASLGGWKKDASLFRFGPAEAKK